MVEKKEESIRTVNPLREQNTSQVKLNPKDSPSDSVLREHDAASWWAKASRSIQDLGPGDHLCIIYETEAEHKAILTPFLRSGLEKKEKVIYIVDARTSEAILGYLRGDGVDIEPYLTSGQLSVLSRDDSYTRDGVFDPDGMISLLREETGKALDEGFTALRVTGEMTWALRGLPGSERLIEYEMKLNEFFPGSRCLAICQYDRRQFDSSILIDVLRTHPIAVIGMNIYDNFYFIPPGELSGSGVGQAAFKRMLDNLHNTNILEQSLIKAKEEWEITFDAMTDWVSLINPRTRRIRRSNRSGTLFTGLGVKDIIGQNCCRIVHGLGSPISECPVEKMLQTKHLETSEFHDTNSDKWFMVTAEPIFDTGGDIIGAVHVVSDITGRKRIEIEREQLVDELQEALAKIRTLRGLLPICSSCKKIRDDQGYWRDVELYVRDHSEADFSHSFCPECLKKLYPHLSNKSTDVT